MDLKRLCFACDLIDDAELIEAYIKRHENVWPEIKSSIKDSGIINMEIYNIGNRLFMIMDVEESFSLEKKSNNDINNSKVQEWENLMWKYQQQLPWANKGEKWMLLKQIFKS
jgi:L-rhamnose mutarotase